MTDSNAKTIQAYEAHVQDYINGTPQDVSGVVKKWIDEAIADLTTNAHILEFGSANGRDAAYLQDLGYKVNCTDATPAFVELLLKNGFQARKLNAITDELGGPYDLVLANAVLLHFTRDETRRVLQKVLRSLKPGGTFAFTLKQGEGEEWSQNKLGAPRFFHYWSAEDITKLLQEVGFAQIKVSSDVATTNAIWLQVIVRKK